MNLFRALFVFVVSCLLASTTQAGTIVTGGQLETHIVPGVDPGVVEVLLEGTYASPVVVCSVLYASNTSPVVTRILSVTPNSFRVSLQAPGTSSQKGQITQPETVYCIVAEEGVHEIDGHTVEARKYLSTVTDRKNSWTGTPQTLMHSFTNPVVLGQVMSFNDPRYSVFWDRGPSRSAPPTPLALTTGKMIGEDPDTSRNPETIGYIVFEAGHGTIGGVEFETGVGPTTVQGIDNGPPFAYTFDTTFASTPQLAVVSLAGMRGGDGGWAQLHPASPAITQTTIHLSADEDQIADAERNHATERVAYAAFAEEFVWPPQAPTMCELDADCDDGLWCNGQETCGFIFTNEGVCTSGLPECLGQICDENADQCVTGPAMRLESLSLAGVGGSFQTVPTSHTYVEPVVVCTAEYQNNEKPIVVRLNNVSPGGFDVKLQNPSGGPVNAEEVFCLVIEAGAWEQDGVRFEAQRYTASVTDRKNAWIGQVQSYLQGYASPVVVGQVMTYNDTDFSVYWQQGATRTSPPSAATLINGKTVLEDPDRTRADETVGFIVFEAGHGTFLDSKYEAATGPDTVQSPQNGPPFVYSFLQPFATAPQFAVTSMAGVDGGDGAWSQLHPASPPTTPTTIKLSVDEDQVGDNERSHANEQVNYIVFERNVAFPPVNDCDSDDDCPGYLDFCDGVDRCQAGACVNDGPPCIAGQTCDEQSDSCESSSQKLETVVIPSVGDAGGMAPRVDLVNTYTDPVVVCTVQYVSNTVPVVPRVFDVDATGFSVGTQNPGDGPHAPDTVHCLVVEQGVWMIGDTMIEARKYTSTVTDNDPNWLGTAQTLIHPFADPVIVGQVMSREDERFSVYWQQGAGRSLPPSSTALRNGKTVLEDSQKTRNDEVIGYIAFERGCGTINGVRFEAFLTADFVKGIDNGPPFTHPLSPCFVPPKGPGSPMVGVLSTAGMDGIDGAWPYFYGPNALRPTAVDLAVDEDQLENAERSHTTEQIMGIVFETDVVAGIQGCAANGLKSARAVDPNCDGDCDVGDELLSDDCEGICDSADEAGSPDCDGRCDEFDAAFPAPDCNQLCELSEYGPDCDGVCVPEEVGSPDCDFTCEFGEENSPDCDGICDDLDFISPSPDCNQVCEPNETGPDCDGICDDDEEAGPDCNGVCDHPDDGFPDCNGACDQPGDGFGDCNGACDQPGDEAGPDCNGLCDHPGDGFPDCNDACDQPGDGFGDCNGACDQPGEEAGPDCNGVCDHPFDVGGPDCNGACDQPGEEAGPDCDGACNQPGEEASPDCNGACDQPGEAGGPDCDGACNQPGEDGGPDCNGACDQPGEGGGPDCNDACDQPGEDGGPDCNGVCNQPGEDGGPDCDGSCQFGDGFGDCNGVCEPGEDGAGTDCDEVCEPGEGGSPDCNGACDQPGEAGGPDCNGVCDQPGESPGLDCNNACDQPGEEGGPDCNGFCDEPGEDPGPDCNGVCQTTAECDTSDCDFGKKGTDKGVTCP